MKVGQYKIGCFWDSRGESMASLADRCIRMTHVLDGILPACDPWHFLSEACQRERFVEDIKGELPALIYRSCVDTMPDGSPVVQYGYRFYTANGQPDDPLQVFINISAGADTFGGKSAMLFPNLVRLQTAKSADTALVNYDVFRETMLAIRQDWDAEYCEVYSDDLMAFWDHGPYANQFRSSWMTFLGPELARHVGPPRSIETEWLPGGGLLMTATRELFDAANPAHLAAARAIEAAVAPLAALRP